MPSNLGNTLQKYKEYEFGLVLVKRLEYDVDVYMNPYECEYWLDKQLNT